MRTLAMALAGLAVAMPVGARDFEVWLVDQSNSFGKTHGRRIFIYEGAELDGFGGYRLVASLVNDSS